MKAKWLVMLAAVFCNGLSGCTSVRHLNNISQVSYTSDSGTILPELQWHEEIIITENGVTFSRNGRVSDTAINEGSWQIAVDARQVAALFAQLEAIDPPSIKRIEPDSPLDGGDTETYTISYGPSKSYSLVYDPGVTYTNGELVTQPMDTFIQTLDFPDEVLNRYK